MKLNQIIADLIDRAIKRDGDITPAGSCPSLQESVTILDDGRVMLWYNLPNGSTAAITSDPYGGIVDGLQAIREVRSERMDLITENNTVLEEIEALLT